MAEHRLSKDIFCEALDLGADERAAYLDAACAGDATLRSEVESLLVAFDASGSFLAPLDSVPLLSGAVLAPGDMVGRYRVLELAGEGGFGAVYRAEQQEPIRREVALKVIKLGMDTRQVIARFETERQALAMMDHPNVARVFDAGATDEGRPYFVMEHVAGKRITDYCDEQRLDIRTRLGLFLETCDAIHHAHQKGIIHRDIKPSNVLVRGDDGGDASGGGTPRVKVIDFGISKAIDQRLTGHTIVTTQGQLVGTPQYMSPEQAGVGEPDIDTRTDVYSLGVLLYELLTGTLPVASDGPRDMTPEELRRILRDTVAPSPSTRVARLGDSTGEIARQRGSDPRSIRRDLRGDLDWITLRAIEPERSRRYGSVAELAADITRHLRHEPVLARPPSATYRLGRFVRRHAIGLAAIASVVLALVVGVIVSTAMYVRSEERAEALRRGLYFADVALAQNAYARMSTAPMVERLERCPPDLHHWEWHYLNRLADTSTRTLGGHDAEATSVVFSRDGGLVASTSRDVRPDPTDNSIRIWSTAGGAPVAVLRGHEDFVTCAAFAPDGSRVVSSSYDGTIRTWNPRTAAPLATWRGHDGKVSRVAYSPDGSMLASAGEDRTVRLWEAGSGQRLGVLRGHAGYVHDLAWLPDGDALLSASWDGTVRRWDVESGRGVVVVEQAETIWYVAVNAGGTKFAWWGVDDVLHVADLASGDSLLRVPELPLVRGVVFTPDGRIAAGSRLAIRVWRLDTGEEEAPRLGHLARVTDLALSPDGRAFASGSIDGAVKLWDAAPRVEPQALRGHNAPVRRVAFFPDGTRLASAGRDRTVRIWALPEGRELLMLEGHTAAVEALAVDAQGHRVASGGADRTVRVWSVATGTAVHALQGHGGVVRGVAFSPDGRRLASACSDGVLRIWNAVSGEVVRELAGATGALRDELAFSPDGRRLASSLDGGLEVWDVGTGEPPMRLGTEPGVGAVAFSPDGRLIAHAGRSLRIWDARTGAMVHELRGHEGSPQGVAFSPDGARLVSTGYGGLVKVWEVATGQSALTLGGQQHGAPSVAFSPDGRRIAAARSDGSVSVWSSVAPP